MRHSRAANAAHTMGTNEAVPADRAYCRKPKCSVAELKPHALICCCVGVLFLSTHCLVVYYTPGSRLRGTQTLASAPALAARNREQLLVWQHHNKKTRLWTSKAPEQKSTYTSALACVHSGGHPAHWLTTRHAKRQDSAPHSCCLSSCSCCSVRWPLPLLCIAPTTA
ncbi:hypothetical protein COO60DRAFT_1030214 [Scenedesmus sp. NREL 46B-D3]|nr:hypothetical protein COO60DRAFT_1030214 [Scenedesmus sp. NREL 46B-D3]